jgi:hypothetical protein
MVHATLSVHLQVDANFLNLNFLQHIWKQHAYVLSLVMLTKHHLVILNWEGQ